MPSGKRDPRTDPKAGDVALLDGAYEQTVSWCRFGALPNREVAVLVGFEDMSYMRLSEYAERAKVIHAAE